MKKYSQLTDAEREEIIRRFREAVDMGATDCKHAAAIAAHGFFRMTDRQWNSKMGSDAYATVLGVVVHKDAVALQFVRQPYDHKADVANYVQDMRSVGMWDGS